MCTTSNVTLPEDIPQSKHLPSQSLRAERIRSSISKRSILALVVKNSLGLQAKGQEEVAEQKNPKASFCPEEWLAWASRSGARQVAKINDHKEQG